MPNQTISKNNAFQVLTELDKPTKDYFFTLKEIQALHNAVIHFIGNESNPQFKKTFKRCILFYMVHCKLLARGLIS
jgi:hypothetical protein